MTGMNLKKVYIFLSPENILQKKITCNIRMLEQSIATFSSCGKSKFTLLWFIQKLSVWRTKDITSPETKSLLKK